MADEPKWFNPPESESERPPPQDAPAPPWRWPARTKASEPVTLNRADPVLNWAAWRAAQVPRLEDWNPLTQDMPESLKEQVLSGGPIGTSAPGAAFAGILRAPLTKTKAKYEHPVTGEEPRRVFHGTTKTFHEFDPAKADPNDLYGPGLYFTEKAEVAGGTGRRMKGADPGKAESYELGYANVDPFGAVEWEAAQRQAPQVHPAHLDIRKPFDIEARVDPDEVRRLLEDAGHPIAEWRENLEQMAASRPYTGNDVYKVLVAHFGSKGVVNDFLREAGYDGITHIGGKGTDTHRVWIAFSPDQIISPFEYAARTSVQPRKPVPKAP